MQKEGILRVNPSHTTKSPEPAIIMVEHNGNIETSIMEEIVCNQMSKNEQDAGNKWTPFWARQIWRSFDHEIYPEFGSLHLEPRTDSEIVVKNCNMLSPQKKVPRWHTKFTEALHYFVRPIYTIVLKRKIRRYADKEVFGLEDENWPPIYCKTIPGNSISTAINFSLISSRLTVVSIEMYVQSNA